MITRKSINSVLPPAERRSSYIYSADEINNAVRVVQSCSKGRAYETAMARLIKQFYPYIVKRATQIEPSNIEDKIMAGCEGLLYAARRFNLDSGNKFFTFAYTYIFGYMQMDFRSTRLIKVTSTTEAELKKPGNEVAYANVTAPLSLDKISAKVADSDNKKSIEDMLSDGMSYEDIAIEYVDADERNRILREIIFEEGKDEAYSGITWAEVFCHLNGLFEFVQMSMDELCVFFGIPKTAKGVIRSHCRKIKTLILNSRKLRKVLDVPRDYVPAAKKPSKKLVPTEDLPFMHTPEYSIKGIFTQTYFDLDLPPEEEAEKIVRKYTKGTGSGRSSRIADVPNQIYFDFGPNEAVI